VKLEKVMRVTQHDEGENEKEVSIEFELLGDDGEYNYMTLMLPNEEAKQLPVNSRVKLTIEPV
jgi:hypothetical protein